MSIDRLVEPFAVDIAEIDLNFKLLEQAAPETPLVNHYHRTFLTEVDKAETYEDVVDALDHAQAYLHQQEGYHGY